MAVSPRRSSRARTSQPVSVPPHNTNSSASSVSSSRTDRNARPQHKMPSPRSSLAARSPSGDDAEDVEKAQPRRTRSSQDEIKEDPAAAIDDEADEESEEEVTRCICGSLEYPGLPVTSTDATRQPARSDANSSLLSEDSTGWFIQCDKCKVWQHGGCVGIMDESTSPEEYFCEQCRKDLHRISTDLKGYVWPLAFGINSDQYVSGGDTRYISQFKRKRPIPRHQNLCQRRPCADRERPEANGQMRTRSAKAVGQP